MKESKKLYNIDRSRITKSIGNLNAETTALLKSVLKETFVD